MKLPSRVSVAPGVFYEIVYIDSFTNDADQVGECWKESRQIRIKNGLSPQKRFETFIHELLHAIEFECGQLDPDNQFRITHDAVYGIAKHLPGILKRNGWHPKRRKK